MPQDTLYTKFCGVPQGEGRDLPERRLVQGLRRPAVDARRRRSTATTSSQQGNVNWPQLNDPAINTAMKTAALVPVGPERNKAWAKINHMIAEQAPGDPVPLGQDRPGRAPRTSNAVANGYYDHPRPELHLPQVGGRDVQNHTEAHVPRRPHGRRGAASGLSPAPPKLMIPFIIRRLLWMVVLLLVISFLTFVIFYTLPAADPATLRAGRQPDAGAAGHASATRSASTSPGTSSTCKYLDRLVFHFDFGYSFQNNVSVKSADLRPPARDDGAGGRRRDRLAAGRHPGRDHLRHQARHVDGPRGDGHRARRDLGPGLLARPRLAVPVLQGPRQVPALRGPGRLPDTRQHLHRSRRR